MNMCSKNSAGVISAKRGGLTWRAAGQVGLLMPSCEGPARVALVARACQSCSRGVNHPCCCHFRGGNRRCPHVDQIGQSICVLLYCNPAVYGDLIEIQVDYEGHHCPAEQWRVVDLWGW